MISGYYPEEPDFLSNLDYHAIVRAVEKIEQRAKDNNLTVFIGSALKSGEEWYNCTLVLGGTTKIVYKKNNLSILDRKHFREGNELSVYKKEGVQFGIQMCRELAFPEQWKLLKKSGAQIIFHINNSIKETDKMREHVLIARAFENQLWVCSVNNANMPQRMVSMIIDPTGTVVWQSTPQTEQTHEVDIDLSIVSTVYLGQERTDLVDVVSND